MLNDQIQQALLALAVFTPVPAVSRSRQVVVDLRFAAQNPGDVCRDRQIQAGLSAQIVHY